MGINYGEVLRKIIHLKASFFFLFLTFYLSQKNFNLLVFFLFLMISFWEFLRLRGKFFFLDFFHMKILLKEDEEKRVSDAWYFVLGVFLASLLLWGNEFRALLLVLGVADVMAFFVGKAFGLRWGNRVLLHHKTLYGSLSFFVVTFLILYAFNLWSGENFLYLFLLSLGSTLGELCFRRDNLTTPLGYSLAYVMIELWLR